MNIVSMWAFLEDKKREEAERERTRAAVAMLVKAGLMDEDEANKALEPASNALDDAREAAAERKRRTEEDRAANNAIVIKRLLESRK